VISAASIGSGFAGEANSMGIIEPLRLATELFQKNTVLLLQIVNHVLLPAIYPASDLT